MRIKDVEALSLVVPMKKAIAAPISLPHADRLAPVVFKQYQSTLVRIRTDDGCEGVGECMVRLAPTASRDAVRELSPILIGMNPFDYEVIWELLYGAIMNRGHNKGLLIEAISGIDMALWDLMGKISGKPVYELLGGCHNERIWAYASSLRFRGEEVTRAEARRFLEIGFNAIKIKVGRNPHDARDDIALVRLVRDEVGDDVALFVDANCGYARPTALYAGRAFEELGVLWLEEPLTPEDYEGYAALARDLDMAVAAGETEFLRYGFRDLILRGQVDILQPDIARAGGFTEGKKIAALASTFHVPVAPHTGSNSVVCLAATLHYAASLSNFYIYEYMQTHWNKEQPNPLQTELAQLPIAEFKDSCIRLEAKPGLGLELNEDIISRYRIGG